MAKPPKELNFDEYADELLAEGQPRALVILGAAQIDDQLKRILQAFFFDRVDKNDELLDGDSPLATFSSRIRICYRLGLIDDRLHKELHNLRDLRNQAAHWIAFGIDGAPLKDQIRSLQEKVAKRKSYKLTINRFFESAHLSPLQRLQATLLTLSALVATTHEKASASPLKSAFTRISLD